MECYVVGLKRPSHLFALSVLLSPSRLKQADESIHRRPREQDIMILRGKRQGIIAQLQSKQPLLRTGRPVDHH